MVSKFEKRLVQAAKEAVAFARGELDPKTYRVHHRSDDDDAAPPLAGVLMREHPKVFYKSGAGRTVRAARKGHKRPMMARKKK